MITYISKPFKWFFKLEAASGLVLLISAILALVISNSDQYDLPVVTFPGNLGNEKTLLESFRLMESNF